MTIKVCFVQVSYEYSHEHIDLCFQLFKGSEYGLDSPLAFNAKDNFKINPCEKGPPTSAESRLLASVFEIGQGNPFHSKLHGPTTLYLTEG